MSWIKKQKGWLLPILAMIVVAPFTPDWDLAVSRYFYMGDGKFQGNAHYHFIFDYGPVPAFAVGVLALFWLTVCFFNKKYAHWRNPSLILLLTLIVGAGFITHTLLKDHWGRPRPKQVIEFGGKQEFRPFYKPNFFNQPEPSKSFPCGHCSMGFFFFAFAFVGYRLHHKVLVWGSYLTAIGLGSALSLTRIAQGGHFLSDILMTALIMWLTAYICDWMVYERSD